MNFIYRSWCALIDITTVCHGSCVYCTRFVRHLRTVQRRHMTVEQFANTLNSLENWPTDISIFGGEPLLHPQLPEINALTRQHVPQEKVHLFTSLAAGGIPVREAADFFGEGAPGPLPFVIFAREGHMEVFLRRIRDEYAQYSDGTLILCPLAESLPEVKHCS